jgi:hypothetical protein
MPRLTFTNENDLDATDITLLQFPELWDNTLKTFRDICYYGVDEEQEIFWCFDCKKMTSKKKQECCDSCWNKLMIYKASLKKK